jgi:D-glycero-alpha-D-manno-heptose-7-phosphate kinase
LIREAMKLTGLTKGLEITTVADLPAGIGLGSSSTLTVGVLNALYAMKGEWRSHEDLARQACEIEIDILKKPIGKQDQYIAAYGGLQDIRFLQDGTVSVHPVVCSAATREKLVRSLLLFYTGMQRAADTVLTEAKERLASRSDTQTAVDGLVDLAAAVREALVCGEVEQIARLLYDSWKLKKQMAANVSNSHLDDLMEAAHQAGADGGKIAGAGAGGCLLLFADPSRHEAISAAMTRAGLRRIPFELEPEGTRIIHFSL